jgi:hypothetical protein
MKDSARESYAPSLLPPVIFLPLLNHPLPLGLKLIGSLPHADGATAILILAAFCQPIVIIFHEIAIYCADRGQNENCWMVPAST